MAVKREEAPLRLNDQAGDCNGPCVERCALLGAGSAVVIERLTELRRELINDAEIVEVILEMIVSRARSSRENVEYVTRSVGTSVRHASCYQLGHATNSHRNQISYPKIL